MGKINQTSSNRFHNHSTEYFLHSQDDNLRPPLIERTSIRKKTFLLFDMTMPIIFNLKPILLKDIFVIYMQGLSDPLLQIQKYNILSRPVRWPEWNFFSAQTLSILHGQWAIFNAHDGVTTKANAIFDTWTYCGILCGGILPPPTKLSIGSVASLWWLNSMDSGCGEKKINKQ